MTIMILCDAVNDCFFVSTLAFAMTLVHTPWCKFDERLFWALFDNITIVANKLLLGKYFTVHGARYSWF